MERLNLFQFFDWDDKSVTLQQVAVENFIFSDQKN